MHNKYFTVIRFLILLLVTHLRGENVLKKKFAFNVQKSYTLHFEEVDWADANQKCIYKQMHLVSIKDEKESELITEKLLQFQNLSFVPHFWTSGMRHLETTNFLWWDNSFVEYSNWASKQPDNYEREENCIVLNKLGKWADVVCELKYGYICEMIDVTGASNLTDLCCRQQHGCLCPSNEGNCDPKLEIALNKKYLELMALETELKSLEKLEAECGK